METLGPLPAFLRLWVEFLFIRLVRRRSLLFILTPKSRAKVWDFQAGCGVLRVPGFRSLRGGAFLCPVPGARGAHQTCEHPRSE